VVFSELRARQQAVEQWSKRLSEELSTLPDTLVEFREGVANFRAVSERLERVTIALERILAHAEASGLTEAVRRVDETALAVERQLSALRRNAPGADLAGQALGNLQHAMENLAAFVPGFPARAPDEPRPESRGTTMRDEPEDPDVG
jgi:hypothetical protein